MKAIFWSLEVERSNCIFWSNNHMNENKARTNQDIVVARSECDEAIHAFSKSFNMFVWLKIKNTWIASLRSQ